MARESTALRDVVQAQDDSAAMQLAEEAREKEWKAPSFVAELFRGIFRTELVFPFPEQTEEDRQIGDAFVERLETFLLKEVDANAIDRTGKVPPKVIQGLKDLGAFAMKIDQKYGGLGLSHTNYVRALACVGGHCGSTGAWLSAHQSIGVPQPLNLFGTEEQRKKYMPRLTKSVSAFALTEVGVGSDPAAMTMTATRSRDGRHWTLNGRKLWCTNGAVAEILVVMARTPDVEKSGKVSKQISAFIVENSMPGFRVVHRCRFMGLNGIENALLEFDNVEVPSENLIGEVGQGLKIALTTLNTGRLSLPAICVGIGKKCLEVMRHWTKERVQWGTSIGNHEEIARKNALVASGTFATEAITYWTAEIVDRGGQDVRLEAAMAKLFSTELTWKIVNETLQTRGGRGYETADSLRARGETPIPIERALRDIRVNTILEGSTEIMHLFIAREALDFHLQNAQSIIGETKWWKKGKAILKCLGFYLFWYPRLWIFWTPSYSKIEPSLAKNLQYVYRTTRRLARSVFHALLTYRLKLEKRQLILARLVDIGTEIFAMSLCCSRAQMMITKQPADRGPIELALLYCSGARRRIYASFHTLKHNNDRAYVKISEAIMEGSFGWLEEGTIHGNIPWPEKTQNSAEQTKPAKTA